jgi:peptidoglycan/LPS O-acetylase OafA/YrhL
MDALPAARSQPLGPVPDPRVPMVGVLRVLLLTEAGGALALAIFLSLLAGGQAELVGGDAGRSAEVGLRFAAGASIIFAILAAVASRGARRRRPSAWTLAAMLQVAAAVATGAAALVTEWHPLFLAGFAIAALVMLVLSTASVRRALGQEPTPNS